MQFVGAVLSQAGGDALQALDEQSEHTGTEGGSIRGCGTPGYQGGHYQLVCLAPWSGRKQSCCSRTVERAAAHFDKECGQTWEPYPERRGDAAVRLFKALPGVKATANTGP